VAYNFTRKGVVEVAKADGVDEDSILMAVLEAGAEEGGGAGGGRKTPGGARPHCCVKFWHTLQQRKWI